eukprot:Opistho-2@16617
MKQKRNPYLPLLAGAVLLTSANNLFAQAEQEWKGKITKSHKTSTPYKVDYLKKAKAGSPNVVVILLDDVGYGATGTFGGLINTPTFDALANNGLRYTNFHTAGICSHVLCVD